jgi:hypothetical protein
MGQIASAGNSYAQEYQFHGKTQPRSLYPQLIIQCLLTRASIRAARQLLDPDGSTRRFPGSKSVIRRGTLQSDGPLRELSADGHEKLNSQALQMGPVALNIYAMRDKWTGAVLLVRVVPNDRCRETIAHLFLDFVSTYGGA